MLSTGTLGQGLSSRTERGTRREGAGLLLDVLGGGGLDILDGLVGNELLKVILGEVGGREHSHRKV